jgi:hypothetical protein
MLFLFQMEFSGDGLMLRTASAAEQSCWITALQQYIAEWAEYRQKIMDEKIRKDEQDQEIFNERRSGSGYETKEGY